MRKTAKLVTGAALMGMAAAGCTSSYEDAHGGGNTPFLGSSESYANPENFLVTAMHTDTNGVSKLALRGCIEFAPDGYNAVQTLGNGYEVDKKGKLWLTGRDEAVETDRFRDAAALPAEEVNSEELFARLEASPKSFIAGEHSVECGYDIAPPTSVQDHETGQEVAISSGSMLLGSVVNVSLNSEGQPDPETFTILVGGGSYSPQ